MSEHTAGQVEAKRFDECRFTIGQVGEEFQVIAVTCQGNDEANAARMVQCWNSHDLLVRALEKVELFLDYPGNGAAPHSAPQATVEACLSIIREAIGKAANK